MEIRRCRLTDAVAAPLLAGLTHEYSTRYGASDEMQRATAEQFEPPGGAFVVLVDDGVTIAGGGYRFLEAGVCEVKRMWTHPDHRRRGLATVVLDVLEDLARAAGYRALRLETGPLQPEAIALYEDRGYRRIPIFGHYPQALAFEVDLTRLEAQEDVTQADVTQADPTS